MNTIIDSHSGKIAAYRADKLRSSLTILRDMFANPKLTFGAKDILIHNCGLSPWKDQLRYLGQTELNWLVGEINQIDEQQDLPFVHQVSDAAASLYDNLCFFTSPSDGCIEGIVDSIIERMIFLAGSNYMKWLSPGDATILSIVAAAESLKFAAYSINDVGKVHFTKSSNKKHVDRDIPAGPFIALFKSKGLGARDTAAAYWANVFPGCKGVVIACGMSNFGTMSREEFMDTFLGIVFSRISLGGPGIRYISNWYNANHYIRVTGDQRATRTVLRPMFK